MGSVLVDQHQTVSRFGNDIRVRHLHARDAKRVALGFRWNGSSLLCTALGLGDRRSP